MSACKSLMAKWLEQASQWREVCCHYLEVMSSNPSQVELGVRSTSVLSCTWTKNHLFTEVFHKLVGLTFPYECWTLLEYSLLLSVQFQYIFDLLKNKLGCINVIEHCPQLGRQDNGFIVFSSFLSLVFHTSVDIKLVEYLEHYW